MTKEKALYQVKLILDCLPKEEYKLIPEETIKYIEENMQVDENIKVIPTIPLEKQKIDEKAYQIWEKIIADLNLETNTASNSDYQTENIRLKQLMANLINKNQKLNELLKKKQEELNIKENEIKKMSELNNELYLKIRKMPKILQRIYFKNFGDKKFLC